MGIAMLEPSLPLWTMETMNAPKWQQGTDQTVYPNGSVVVGNNYLPALYDLLIID